VTSGFFTENTPNRFWLAFSNPRRNTGYFYEAFNSKREFWKSKIVDARTVEGTDKQVYEQIIAEYGPDSSQAHVEVYGQFPNEGDDQFISIGIDEAAALQGRIGANRGGRRPCAVRSGRDRHRRASGAGHIEADQAPGRRHHDGGRARHRRD
jgi:hypothetical protein